MTSREKNIRENLEKNMTGKFAETDADFLKIVRKPSENLIKYLQVMEIIIAAISKKI